MNILKGLASRKFCKCLTPHTGYQCGLVEPESPYLVSMSQI